MSDGTAVRRYLRSDVQAEPLVASWHAWAHLIAPHSAALALANLQLEMMSSFVAAPQVHMAALRNPSMRGGPFIALPESAVPAVRVLLERTRESRSRMLELATAIKQLQARVASATGGSLEPLYAEIPEPLRGRVELVYDVAHQPSVRYLEPLLYRSAYGDRDAQELELSQHGAASRPFIFSTPRLASASRLRVKVPFASDAIDALFGSREQPLSLGELTERLGLEADAMAGLEPLFADRTSYRGQSYEGDGVRVRYFGHACVLIESRRCAVLVDPLISYGGSPADPVRFDVDDLPPRIDYVLITHGHADHLSLETLLQIRHKVGTVLVPRSSGGGLADPSLRLLLTSAGFAKVRDLDALESVDVDGGALMAIPFLGEHGDLDVQAKAGWSIRLEGRHVVLTADSCNLAPELYRAIADVLGPVDALFVGLECDGAPVSWNYGHLLVRPLPRDKDRSRRLSSSDAVQALGIVEAIAPRKVYVYAMGLEPWLEYITNLTFDEDARPLVEARRFVEACRARDTFAERLYGIKELAL